jgi:hypothetical protein
MNTTSLKFDPSMFGPFIQKKIVITRILLVTMRDLTSRVIRTSKIDDRYFVNSSLLPLLRGVLEELLGEEVIRVEPIEIEDW